MLRRLPIESPQPVLTFAAIRLALAAGSLALLLALALPYDGKVSAVVAALAIPWAVALLVVGRHSPERLMSPWVPAGDFAVLLVVELVEPETYGAVRFMALFLVAVHAHFQGERLGLALGAGGAGALILGSVLRGGAVVGGGVLAFYESAFGILAVTTSLLVGRLRTAETASRLRARRLTRRTLEAERQVRRRVAEAIHDGPVQDLIGLDMLLAAAHQAADGGDGAKADELIREARELASRNVRALRDEIVDLGPYAFEELTFDVAVSNCLETWKRRYGFEVMLSIERLELPPELTADLFAITQEAISNAGRHAKATTVTIHLRSLEGDVELRVMDDGEGFAGADPLAPAEPGHLGLASMRERAELLGGTLRIEPSDRGTKVVVRAPLARRTRRPRILSRS